MPGSLIVSMDGVPLDTSIAVMAGKGANPSGKLVLSAAASDEWMVHASYSDKCSLGDSRVYQDDRYVACFVGALVDHTAIPWQAICEGLETGDHSVFNSFQASHAIIVYSKEEHAAYLVTDKFGQYSLYAGILNGQLMVSTCLHTFLHVLDKPEIDPAWLHEFFFFNYPMAGTTLLKGVDRIGPGRVARVDLRSGKTSEERYAPQLQKQETSFSTREAQARALEVFSERFPSYYDNIEPDGCGVGVTGGFDARIVASYMPDDVAAHLYTYGIEGCSDMVNGKKVAEQLGLTHHPFAFDTIGGAELQTLAADTVYYSGGNLNALRSTLAKVYQQLMGAGMGVILTGVSSGHFFRGVFSSPQVVSAGGVDLIRDPAHIPDKFYDQLFLDSDSFRHSLETKREYLLEELSWRDMSLAERHMSFMHYEQAPKYFGGELAFAESFGHMRSPFWDGRIRELSYEIPLSTMHNSMLVGGVPPTWESKAMLGYILAHGRLKGLNVDGMPPKYWASGSKLGYYAGKVIHKGGGKLMRTLLRKPYMPVPLEDWGAWVKEAFLPLLESFEGSPLSRYIDPEAVKDILKGNASELMPMHWIGKLVTASLVLDLVEKRLPHYSN